VTSNLTAIVQLLAFYSEIEGSTFSTLENSEHDQWISDLLGEIKLALHNIAV
jgi:hypothetical protein